MNHEDRNKSSLNSSESNRLREEYYRLDHEYIEKFGEAYFPPVGFMHGYTEQLEDTVEKLSRAIEPGEKIPIAKPLRADGVDI